MRLTILGASGVRPNAGDACAGYLVESGERRILLDCGPGITAPLLDRIAMRELDGVILSHTHPDHCLDLVMLRQSIAYAPRGRREQPLPVYHGPGADRALRALGAAFDDGEYWRPHIELHSYDPAEELPLPGFVATFMRSSHSIPCWAVRLRPDEPRDGVGASDLVYGADGGPASDLGAFAEGAAVLLAEATLPHREGYEEYDGHLSAGEAGEFARRAGVGRLILTHLFDGNDPHHLACDASAACPGIPVTFAAQGDTWTF